jgi:metallo-beta-lactamase family protein
LSLKVKFLGAVDGVTGSCSLLHYERADSYYLVDCGMYQGFPGARERNRRPFDFVPARLSAVFLTHAHIDHCGLLPRLVQEGFDGKILCTKATADLAVEALMDSAQLEGLYTKGEVNKLREMFSCPDSENPDFTFGYFYYIEQDLSYGFRRTAHVTGAVGVEFRFRSAPSQETTVLFSGDIGPATDDAAHGGLLKKRYYPNPSTDFLVVESTYGGRIRPPETVRFDSRIEALAEALRKAFDRGPKPIVLIPAFTMQRTQDLLADLHYVFTSVLPGNGMIPTVVVDSPLARGHTRHIRNELIRVRPNGKRFSLNDEAPLFAGKGREQTDALLNEIFDPTRAERIIGEPGAQWQLVFGRNETFSAAGPVLRLSGSGTSLHGLIVKHLEAHLTNPEATVILTGYTPPGSPGEILKRLMALPEAQRGSTTVSVGNTSLRGCDVKAGVTDLSPFFSGHADQAGLVDFILRKDTDKPAPPLTIFINHGDGNAKAALKQCVEEQAAKKLQGYRPLEQVYLPEPRGGWFHFVKRQWVADSGGSAASAQMTEIQELLTRVLAQQQAILEILKSRSRGKRRDKPPAIAEKEHPPAADEIDS